MRGILADINVELALANPRRVLRERAYAEKTAERVLDYLMRIDQFRGAGRLYAP
jgi:hypothetical protein